MKPIIENPPVFVLIWAAYTLVGVIYPILVISRLRRVPDDARRWIKNNPTFNVHQVFVFPLAAALLFSSDQFFSLSPVPVMRLLSLAVLVGLIALSIFAVLEDLRRPAVEPYLFKSAEPLAVESRIRETVVTNRKQIRTGNFSDRRARNLALEEFAKEQAQLNSEYQATAQPFLTLGGLAKRGGRCAYGALLLNVVGAVTIAIFFWHFFNVSVFGMRPNWEAVSLATGLFCLWFPMRLYAEWYINFYSLKHVASYWAFIFIFFAGIFSCVFLLVVHSTQPIKVVSLLSVALLTVIALIGKFRPNWLGIIAEAIEDMPFRWYVAFIVLIMIGLATIIALTIRAEPALHYPALARGRPASPSAGEAHPR